MNTDDYSPLERYLVLQEKLKELRQTEPVDEAEEDELLDTMDVVWDQMNAHERELVRRRSSTHAERGSPS